MILIEKNGAEKILPNDEQKTIVEKVEKKMTNSGISTKEIDNLYLKKVGGFDLLFHRPIITKDNKHLFIICGHRIRKYLIENGNFLDEYYFGTTIPIVSIDLINENDDEILVVFENGHIIYWNQEENYQVSKANIQINYPDKKIAFLKRVNDHYYFLIKLLRKHKIRTHLCHCPTNKLDSIIDDSNAFYNADIPASNITFGPKENIKFCAIIHRHLLEIYPLPFKTGLNLKKCHFITKEKHLTSIAFHPHDSIIATGDVIGQIFIWHDIQAVSPSRSILHWHSSAVADLVFAPSGSHLYSVGSEMTLIKWNLVGQHFGQKNLLPRVGTQMKFIVIDHENQFIITSHTDQCLHVIDTQLNGIRTVIEGLSSSSGHLGKLSTGLHYNCRLNCLALNGRVGHIQFYCPIRQKQLFQFDVAEQNLINVAEIGSRNTLKAYKLDQELKRKRTEASIDPELKNFKSQKFYPIEITKLAVSDDGHWLATIELRDDHETFPEIRLKFWLIRKENNGFRLNTTVHLPHQDEVNFILFSSRSSSIRSNDDKSKLTASNDSDLHLISTSNDCTFKIWDLIIDSDNGTKWWNCFRNGSLNNQSIPRQATFSSDSSLVSILFDNTITLWELDSPKTIRFIPRIDAISRSKTELTSKPSTIIFIAFARGKLSHYLIEGYKNSVIVRNVIKKFEIVFQYRQSKAINSIEINQMDHILALISIDSINFLCLQTHQIVCCIDLKSLENFHGNIISSIFVPTQTPIEYRMQQQQFNQIFYCINDRNEIFQAIQTGNDLPFDCEEDCLHVAENEREKKAKLFIEFVEKKITPFTLLRSHRSGHADRSKSVDDSESFNVQQLSKALVDQYFLQIPTHVLPPLNMIEKNFFNSYLDCLHIEDDTVNQESNLNSKMVSDDKEIEKISINNRQDNTNYIDQLKLNESNAKHSEETILVDPIEQNQFYWLKKCLRDLNKDSSEIDPDNKSDDPMD
ncbi:Anoctamin-1 [Sarcoptes scabiei]|nr:Anoctamin-1 [Sarcoptes scabiei]